MKKADFLVITIILLISIGFYAIYFSNNLISSDSYGIEIYYNNQKVFEEALEETTKVTVCLDVEDVVLYVKVDRNNDGIYESTKEYLNLVSTPTHTHNVVHIEYGNIHMVEANCENKLCLNMRIGKTLATPIFCTNNVLIKLVTNDYKIITG